MTITLKLFSLQWAIKSLLFISFSLLINACEKSTSGHGHANNNVHGGTEEIEKGIHGGRLLKQDDFTLELTIFETGVPPEFRAWVSYKGRPLKPADVDLKITLTRLGGKVNQINFIPHDDALRGDRVIYEPHSFIVSIDINHNGIKYNWQYDNFEGRTKIDTEVAKALQIGTDIAGPFVLQQTINVFGKITANTEQVNHVSARFPGVIKLVAASIGDSVRKGQLLANVESNESLKRYNIKAPVSGTIISRNANAGEQTNGQSLFIIADTSNVWVDLSIFPADVQRVKLGASVSVSLANKSTLYKGKVALINIMAEANQSVIARVIMDNKHGQLFPGNFVKAKINIAEIPVSLAVKRSGLQSFRDFTVVYAKIRDEYEVRMLELGREDDEWVEVLNGLEEGVTYVSKNSYVIKADIEKSGASHDH